MLIAIAVLFTCEKVDADPEDIIEVLDTINLKAENSVELSANDITVTIDSTGQLWLGKIDRSFGTYPYAGLVYVAGLWIAHDDPAGATANLVLSGYPSSNYSTISNGVRHGPYSITTSDVWPENSDWIFDQGFPRRDDGSPGLVGDQMVWSGLFPDTIADPVLSRPIPSLTYTFTVWASADEGLETSLFIKYIIKNSSTARVDNLIPGFFADCEIGRSTGYNSQHGLTYTYTKGAVDSTSAAGYCFLEIGGVADPAQIATSHRIMRKSTYVDLEFPHFTEVLQSPEEVVFALKGLSNQGAPMVHPETNQETKFAFTGDPVSETGWLDSKGDVRSLLGGLHFGLDPGDSMSVTVLMTAAEGKNLEDALSQLTSSVARIRLTPGLWD